MKVQNYLQWFRACEVGDIDAIVEALPTYAKKKNSRGDTALILACKRGDRRITKLLAPIEHGICNDRGENAILTAIRYDQPGCVSDMCMYEIATRLKDGSTPLHFAAAMESLRSIVLMHGALKRARDSAGMTSFELACSLGKTESVKKLIELGNHISKHDAARAIKIAKDHGFQNIADYIASFDFPDIDPSVITASMRLLQSSKVSSKALALVAEMSAQEKANVIMSHSKVMTESFKNEVVPPMEGLSESMRLAQQKVCQVVNRYEIDKRKRLWKISLVISMSWPLSARRRGLHLKKRSLRPRPQNAVQKSKGKPTPSSVGSLRMLRSDREKRLSVSPLLSRRLPNAKWSL